jgi:outer membrane immunogenic protein
MKKIALAAAALIIGTVGASAADLGARPYTKAPVVAPIFNWSGFYIGGFVGGAVADRDATSTEPVTAGGVFYNGPLPNSYSLSNSFIGGGTVGWNYQPVGSSWMIGIEGEAGYIRLNRTIQDINAFNNGFALPDSLDNTRLGDWYGVVAGRLGIAAGQFLLYGKGGAAFINKNYSFSDTCTAAPCGPSGLVIGRSDTYVTWAAGGGVEYAFTPNWSIKGEYLYLATRESIVSSGAVFTGPGTGIVHSNVHTDPGIHTGKIGLNYRFGY